MKNLKDGIILSLQPEANDDVKSVELLIHDLYKELILQGLTPSMIKLQNQKPSNIVSRGEPIVSTIFITLATAGVFNAIIETVKSWSLRKESRRTRIKVQIENKSIEYEYSPSSTSQDELLDLTQKINQLLKI